MVFTKEFVLFGELRRVQATIKTLGRGTIVQTYFRKLQNFDANVRRAGCAFLATFPVLRLEDSDEFRLELVNFYRSNRDDRYRVIETEY